MLLFIFKTANNSWFPSGAARLMGIPAVSDDCLSSALRACGNQAVKTNTPFGRSLTAGIIRLLNLAGNRESYELR